MNLNELNVEIDSSNNTPPISTLPLVDKITLEYMTNRKQYNRYLNTESSSVFSPEMQNRIDTYMKYQDHAKEIFSDLLDNYVLSGETPSKKYDKELETLFENFMDTVVDYLEKCAHKESLDEIRFGYLDEFDADDDILFGEGEPRSKSRQRTSYSKNDKHIHEKISSFFGRK